MAKNDKNKDFEKLIQGEETYGSLGNATKTETVSIESLLSVVGGFNRFQWLLDGDILSDDVPCIIPSVNNVFRCSDAIMEMS